MQQALNKLRFHKKSDLANLKSGVDELDIDKLKMHHKLDVEKLVPAPTDLKKWSDNKIVTKDAYDWLKKYNKFTNNILDAERKEKSWLMNTIFPDS